MGGGGAGSYAFSRVELRVAGIAITQLGPWPGEDACYPLSTDV